MALDLAIILILGLLFSKLFEKIKIPGLVGMLLVGILFGPYCFNWLSNSILNISDEIRSIALIIILLRAGLGLKKDELKKVGRPAILMSFIPCILEGVAVMLISTSLLDFTWIQGGILGFIIAAVSPAVVVPAMLAIKEKGLGAKNGVPTLILAGSSVDDIFAITLFSAFIGIYSGEKINFLLNGGQILLSIISGILLGIIVGFILYKFFKKFKLRNTKKVIILISFAILMKTLETVLIGSFAISSLLGVMVVGLILIDKLETQSKQLVAALGRIWVVAEILLFVLVGARVNISVAFDSGLKGLIIIGIGLIFRSIGVYLSTMKTHLNLKERAFCMISYVPKATVQAAIGAIPLTLGVKGGEVILAIAVLSIIVTAPIGAIGIRIGSKKLL